MLTMASLNKTALNQSLYSEQSLQRVKNIWQKVRMLEHEIRLFLIIKCEEKKTNVKMRIVNRPGEVRMNSNKN